MKFLSIKGYKRLPDSSMVITEKKQKCKHSVNKMCFVYKFVNNRNKVYTRRDINMYT